MEASIPEERKRTATELELLNKLLAATEWDRLEKELDPELSNKSNMLTYLHATEKEYNEAPEFLKDRLEWRATEEPIFKENRPYLNK